MRNREAVAMEAAPITVGLDGSPESLAAAHWAAAEADRRGADLCLLHAWVMLAPDSPGGLAGNDQNYWAKRIVHAAEREIHQRYPGLPVVEELVAEEPVTALLRASEDSSVVVLGSRGLGAIGGFFLGDVSLRVAGTAGRPVVLVRAGERAASPRNTGVVAAVSLHGSSRNLLEFAFGSASERGVPLTVLHGLSLPVQAYAPWGIDPDMGTAVSQDAERELRETLRPWRDKYPDVQVTGTVRLESPAQAVVRAAEGADLLVIGRRGHRHRSPRLGPVAHACAHHAACPVALVPQS
ncbi:universal stress protein [Streptomyces sp. NPDC020379]|uniref:universal stress protein n=1 Tax=Streptomyces sp. NPDC020379 TaxID=3365071 RepID=UPI0037BD3C7C